MKTVVLAAGKTANGYRTGGMIFPICLPGTDLRETNCPECKHMPDGIDIAFTFENTSLLECIVLERTKTIAPQQLLDSDDEFEGACYGYSPFPARLSGSSRPRFSHAFCRV